MLGIGWHRGRMGGGPTLWNYLRIRGLSTNAVAQGTLAANVMGANWIQFRAEPGGPALTGVPTASAGDAASANASFGEWQTAGTLHAAGGHWWKLALDTPSDCREVWYKSTATTTRSEPNVMIVEGSLDDVTWTLLWAEADIPMFTSGEAKTFTRAPGKEFVQCWRIQCATTYDAGDDLGCAEQLWLDANGVDIGGGGIHGERGWRQDFSVPSLSRDGNTATEYRVVSGKAAGGNWIGIATHSPVVPVTLRYRAIVPEPSHPRVSAIHRSDDAGLTWQLVKDLGEITPWTAGQVRDFSLT